jgi:MFS transporter, putative metabolite:H+ symporter
VGVPRDLQLRRFPAGPAIAGAIVHLPYGPAAGCFVYVAGIAGRLAFSILPNFLGRRKSVEISGYGVAFTFIGVALFSQHFV